MGLIPFCIDTGTAAAAAAGDCWCHRPAVRLHPQDPTDSAEAATAHTSQGSSAGEGGHGGGGGRVLQIGGGIEDAAAAHQSLLPWLCCVAHGKQDTLAPPSPPAAFALAPLHSPCWTTCPT
jgi:hypothetical protein